MEKNKIVYSSISLSNSFVMLRILWYDFLYWLLFVSVYRATSWSSVQTRWILWSYKPFVSIEFLGAPCNRGELISFPVFLYENKTTAMLIKNKQLHLQSVVNWIMLKSPCKAGCKMMILIEPYFCMIKNEHEW